MTLVVVSLTGIEAEAQPLLQTLDRQLITRKVSELHKAFNCQCLDMQNGACRRIAWPIYVSIYYYLYIIKVVIY